MKKSGIIFLVALCFLYKSAHCMTLREAIAAGNYECACELMMNGTDEESPATSLQTKDNEQGRTIFYMAVEHEDMELVTKIFENCTAAPDLINIVAKNGQSPLRVAIDKLRVMVGLKKLDGTQSIGIYGDVQSLVTLISFLLLHGAQCLPQEPIDHTALLSRSDYW